MEKDENTKKVRIASILLYLTAVASHVSFAVDLQTLAQKARDAMAEGRYADAVPLYEQMVKALPEEAGARLNLALALDGAGRPAEALQNLERIRIKESGNPQFWYLLGNEYLKRNQPLKAIGPLEKATQLSPQESGYQAELAEAHIAAGDPQRAAQIVSPLAKKSPDSPRILALLIRSALAISVDASSKRLRLVSKSAGDPINAEGSTNRLAQLFQQNDFEAIIAQSAAAQSSEDLYWRARASSALARGTLAHLATLPPSSEAHELAGLAYRRAARWEDSLTEYREAVALSPADPALQAELAKALWLARHFDEALETLQPLAATDLFSGDLEFELGDCLLNLGRPEQALPHLRRAAKILPGDFAAQATLGRVLLAMGDNQAAVLALERVADRDVDGSIHFQLAHAYRNLGHTELSRRALARQKEIEQSIRP